MKLKTKLWLLGLTWFTIHWAIRIFCLSIPIIFFYKGWKIALLVAASAYILHKINEDLEWHAYVILFRNKKEN